MIWQDWVISVGQWFLLLTMLPMVKDPPPLKSSLPMGIILFSFAYSFATLDLWWSFASSAANGIMWLFLHAKKRRWL